MKKNEFSLVTQSTGEVLTINRETFDLMPLNDKANGIAKLMYLRRQIDDVLSELKPLMTNEMVSVQEPGKPVKIQTEAGTLVLPGGFSEKKLNEKEAYAFAEALQNVDPSAHKLCIEYIIKISKSEVNKLRTQPGKTSELIKAYFASQQPKALELDESTKPKESPI